MNKTNLAHILFALSITLFVPSYGMMDGLKEKVFKTVENPTVYNAGVAAIDATAKVLSRAITKFAHIPRFQETSEQKNQRISKYIDRIDQRLARIENNLKQDEIHAFNNVYKDFEITDKEQQTINAIIKQYKAFQQQYLCQPHEKTTDTLQSATPEILSLCNQLNIHPTAIELRTADSSIATSLALSTGLKVGYQVDNDNNLIIDNDIVDYPAIILHPGFFRQSYEEGVATIGHELTHLALHHYVIYNILGTEIKYFTGATTEDIKNNKHLKTLETIQERQAEILHKNAKWASTMRNHRYGGYYEGYLFLGHYAQLAEIDELHKLKDKLKTTIG